MKKLLKFIAILILLGVTGFGYIVFALSGVGNVNSTFLMFVVIPILGVFMLTYSLSGDILKKETVLAKILLSLFILIASLVIEFMLLLI